MLDKEEAGLFFLYMIYLAYTIVDALRPQLTWTYYRTGNSRSLLLSFSQFTIHGLSKMTDVHDKKTRRFNMSRSRSKDTKPEMLVRKYQYGF